MSMNMVSNAGTYQVWQAADPAWARLSDGYAYSIAFENATPSPLTTGTFTFQGAESLEGDPCSPDPATWADLVDEPTCDALPGSVAGPAKVTFTPESPLPANSQCHYAISCPDPFLRVAGTAAAGIRVSVVVTRLKRSGAAL